MKTNRIYLSLTLLTGLLVASFLPGCDKLVTEVNNITVIDTTLGKECQSCHTDRNDKLIVVPKAQWANSAHSSPHLLEYPVKLNGQLKTATACGPSCHSGNGYVDSVLTGRVSDTTVPSVINCYTCHLPHTVANEVSLLDSLRGITLAVTLADGTSKYIHGKSNMCANCHRATGAPPTATSDLTLTDKFGPHYSAQADVYNGTAGYRFDSSTILVNNHVGSGFANGCISCHFGKGQGYDFGEHTFRLQYHDATKDTTPYVANCNLAGCHTAGTVANFYAVSNMPYAQPRGDSIKFYADTLRALLESSFILESTDTAGTMYRVGDILPPVAAKILYNYLLYRHDGSRGIHYPQFMNDLLRGSFENWDSIPPRADFVISDNDICVGDSVQFTNRTRYRYDTSLWTFGGGAATSLEQSPFVGFNSVGVYQVILTATGPAGTSLATKPNAVAVHGPITARIHVVDSIVCVNTPVTLVDSSSGIPTSREWFLPDSNKTYISPTLTLSFPNPGTYTIPVELRSFNDCSPGGDTSLRNIFIEVDSTPVCNFGFSPTNIVVNSPIQFTDSSTGPAREWTWIFDSAGAVKDTVYDQSPIYTFTNTGSKEVVLKVKNDCGTSTKSIQVTVNATGISPAEVTPRTEIRR
jgi:PKD repeat protein